LRLTYLAHASLLIEAGGVRLVTDPWLDGPTYLSGWWHFPAPSATSADLADVDYVYLTHEHVDHFHEPTLQRLRKDLPILIGKFMRPRFRDKLRALGFSDVRELPHGSPVRLGEGGMTVVSYQSRADDTALVVTDGEATVLNLNDAIFRGEALAQILAQHPRIDLLCASFANAEAYPIVYDLEDPTERPDWDDAQRFDEFLEKVRRLSPRAFVPFASMFCFLSDDLFPINERIASPAALLARARAGEVAAEGLAMNPGDVWTPAGGHERRSDLDWGDKERLLVEYRRRHATEIAQLTEAEVVPGGAAELELAFRRYFTGLMARLPWVLRRRLELTIRWDVAGAAGQVCWLRYTGGALSFDPPAQGEAWDARIRISDWPLWRVLTRTDTWQTLGVSCRFRVALKAGARAKEALFWLFLYLDDMGYLSPGVALSPRALGVLFRRRRELTQYASSLLRGRFVDQQVRGKFDR